MWTFLPLFEENTTKIKNNKTATTRVFKKWRRIIDDIFSVCYVVNLSVDFSPGMFLPFEFWLAAKYLYS